MASRQLCAPGAILRDEETEAEGTSSRETGAVARENETPAALYVQLADIIREKIYSREWAVKSKIPSEHELMAQFHLARGTVRRAISALVDEGLLVREHGRGTFVAEPGLSHAVESRPFSFAEALHKQGRDFKTAVVDAWVTPAPIDVATELDVPEHSDVMFLRRLRYVDGVPIMCQESWLSLDECPGLCDVDFEGESLFNAVERCAGRKIKYSRMRYSARIAGKDHGELLDCEEGAAILLLEQTISLADYRPIEWSTTWFRPGQSIVNDAVQPD
ncbi:MULTISPECIES: GntR family transcriptional regulator [Enorma]|uniref:GntR family transcriptional regulator n=1 Tax=Enorma TaxID=1472762 RepID=UPI000371D139|nr:MULTISPECIES: GntR family transcriptional regulator [Enorma]